MNRLRITKKNIDLFTIIVYLLIFQSYQKKLGVSGADYLLVAILFVAFICTLAWGSLAESLGKLIKVRKVKEQYKNVSVLRKNVFIFAGITSLIICGIIFLLSGWFANNLLHLDVAVRAIRFLIPVIFFRCMSSAAEGCYIGENYMLPVFVSSVLRPILMILVGNYFYKQFYLHGQKVSALLREEQYAMIHGGAGIALGITISEAVIAILMVVSFFVFAKLRGELPEGSRSKEGVGDHVSLLIRRMLPNNLAAVLKIFPFVVGGIIIHSLYPEENAELFGSYFGGYIVPCLTITVVLAYFTNMIGTSTMTCVKREEKRFAKIGFMSGIHFIVYCGGFFAVLFTVEAEAMSKMLFAESKYVIDMLTCGSFIIVVLLFITFAGFILRKTKKGFIIFLADAVGIIGFVASAYTFRHNEVDGSMILVYAGLLSGGFCAVIMLGYAAKVIRAGLETITVLVIPVISISLCGILFIFLQKTLLPVAGGFGTVFVSAVLGAIIHILILLLSRNIKESELEFLPGGVLLKFLGEQLKVF